MEDILGLGLDPVAGPPAWGLSRPEPTNLIAPWPAPDPPEGPALAEALAEALAVPVDVDLMPPPAPEIVEMLRVRGAQLPVPFGVWCERSRGGIPDTLAPEARWVLGVEAILDSVDPLTGYARLLEMLARLRPELPAVLDVNTGLWQGRAMLERRFAAPLVEPPADVLWMIQVVGGEGDDAPRWIRTTGLHRCGRPELELLEVPAAATAGATALLDDVAALLLETTQWPAPGEPFEIGPELRIVLQPATEVAAFVDAGAGGSSEMRREAAGPAAAICDARPRGAYRPIWTWPADVVAAIDRGESAVYRAPRASRRQAELARLTWPRLAAVLGREGAAARFETAVEAGFETAEGSREHLWFAVQGADGDELDGRLVHAPAQVTTIREGQVARLHREMVSDWMVRTRERRYGPDDIEDLEQHAGDAP